MNKNMNKYETGKTIFYVPSLHEQAIKCKIIDSVNTDPYTKGHMFIYAIDNNGKVIKGFESQFTFRKPAMYNAFLKSDTEQIYCSWYHNNYDNTNVSLERLKETYRHYANEGIYKYSFDEYMHKLTGNGCFVPLSEHLSNNDNIMKEGFTMKEETTNNNVFSAEELKHLAQLASDYKSAASMETEAKKAKEKAGKAIKEIMQDRTECFISEYRIDYKTVCKPVFDSKALKNDIPELYNKYSSEHETRPLFVR